MINSRVIHQHIVQTFPKHLMFVGINPKRFSKEGFSILGHEFFVLAQSIFFGIFTHGQGFQNTRCPAYARQSEIRTVLSRKSFSASAESTVDSAEECPSTSGVTLQSRDANARDFTIRRWQGERQK